MCDFGFRSPQPLSPPYSKSEYGPAFLARAFAVRKNHLLSLWLRKRLLKSGSISLPWALFCLFNLDAVFMQSGPFVVLNSLQLEGCAFNDVRWSPMPLFASSFVSHKRSSPLAAHFKESCYFLFVFSFSYTGFAFPFPPHCFFAGGWLLFKPYSSSDMLWNEFARVWTELHDHESEAIDFDSNMAANKRWK